MGIPTPEKTGNVQSDWREVEISTLRNALRDAYNSGMGDALVKIQKHCQSRRKQIFDTHENVMIETTRTK
jgi:hypothetical protein